MTSQSPDVSHYSLYFQYFGHILEVETPRWHRNCKMWVTSIFLYFSVFFIFFLWLIFRLYVPPLNINLTHQNFAYFLFMYSTQNLGVGARNLKTFVFIWMILDHPNGRYRQMSHQEQFLLEFIPIFFTSSKSPVIEHQITMIDKYRSFTWSMVYAYIFHFTKIPSNRTSDNNDR